MTFSDIADKLSCDDLAGRTNAIHAAHEHLYAVPFTTPLGEKSEAQIGELYHFYMYELRDTDHTDEHDDYEECDEPDFDESVEWEDFGESWD